MGGGTEEGEEGAEEGREGAPPQTTLSHPPTLPSPPHPAPPYLPHKHFQLRSLCAHTTHTSRFMHAPLHTHNLTSLCTHPDSLSHSKLNTQLCAHSQPLHTYTTLATCSTLAGNPALLLTYLIHDKAGLS